MIKAVALTPAALQRAMNDDPFPGAYSLGNFAFSSLRAFWISTEALRASIALANSARNLSSIVLNIRPLFCETVGSIKFDVIRLNFSSVPVSSTCDRACQKK